MIPSVGRRRGIFDRQKPAETSGICAPDITDQVEGGGLGGLGGACRRSALAFPPPASTPCTASGRAPRIADGTPAPRGRPGARSPLARGVLPESRHRHRRRRLARAPSSSSCVSWASFRGVERSLSLTQQCPASCTVGRGATDMVGLSFSQKWRVVPERYASRMANACRRLCDQFVGPWASTRVNIVNERMPPNSEPSSSGVVWAFGPFCFLLPFRVRAGRGPIRHGGSKSGQPRNSTAAAAPSK